MKFILYHKIKSTVEICNYWHDRETLIDDICYLNTVYVFSIMKLKDNTRFHNFNLGSLILRDSEGF